MAFIPCARATDAPASKVSSTIPRFSATDRRLDFDNLSCFGKPLNLSSCATLTHLPGSQNILAIENNVTTKSINAPQEGDHSRCLILRVVQSGESQKHQKRPVYTAYDCGDKPVDGGTFFKSRSPCGEVNPEGG